MKRAFGLTDEQAKEAQKLYYQSSLGPMAAAQAVKAKRVKR